MVPWWAVLILMATTGFFSAIVTYIAKPSKVKEVDRTEKQKEARPLNIFDAYSDKELQGLRQEAAERVKSHRKHGSEWSANEKAKELRKIDDEIQARENTKLALEATKRTEHERDIAIFDTVYSEVLKRSETKEIK